MSRTEHKIKKNINIIPTGVSSIFENAEAYHMKVNCSKTKIMLFDSATKTDFKPLVPSPSGEHLEYVTETKL